MEVNFKDGDANADPNAKDARALEDANADADRLGEDANVEANTLVGSRIRVLDLTGKKRVFFTIICTTKYPLFCLMMYRGHTIR